MDLKEYYRNYRKKNLEKIKENEKRSLDKLKQNPEWLERKKIYRRKYMELYRRRRGVKPRILTGKYKGKPHLRRWLEKLADKYGRFCVKCKTIERLSVNHRIPLCVGGKTEENNLEIMCLRCNVKTYHELTQLALKAYFNKEATS